MQRGHDAGHDARADVLEGESRPMEQLEGEDIRFDFDERDRKVQRLYDHGFERRGIERPSREGAKSAQADFGQRTLGQPCDLVRTPRFDRFGHIESAVRGEAVEERRLERYGWHLTRSQTKGARRYEAHVSVIRAPCGEIAET